MPLSARSRTTSNTGTTGHPTRPGLDQPNFTPDRGLRSREHSQLPSQSESVCSRATEEAEENSELEPTPTSRFSHSCALTRPSAIPPRIHDALTPITRPIEVPHPENLQLPPPTESLFAQAENPSNTSSDGSEGHLLELPGPPSEDTRSGDTLFASRENDGLLNLTTARTPRPPGAWAAMPAPARSQTPQPTLYIRAHDRTRFATLFGNSIIHGTIGLQLSHPGGTTAAIGLLVYRHAGWEGNSAW
ncbi:hypothetical protein EDB85DRAFT_2152370 [Lactarius pseudohatsudake]|nr:hypothetical protein EDB85DRAFT_2152370 [Lactarius pseudohatsudake]